MATPSATTAPVVLADMASTSSRGERILAAERRNPVFQELVMTDFLNGGPELTKLKQDIMEELDLMAEGKLDIDVDDGFDVRTAIPNEKHSLEEVRIQTMAMARVQYARLMDDAGVSIKKRSARMELMSLYDPSWFTRNGVHFGLWLNAVQGQGTPEQVAEFLPKSLMFQVFGCFAMTELGHGSFVRGVETTATFDPATQTFDLHTPAVTATKWWIGGAANTATHAAVFAQVVLPDRSRPGVHAFIVQLRDLETHEVLPNIRIGDCGPKMGRDGIDNGFIQFNHLKLSKDALLSKYCELSPEGEYKAVGSKQMEYGALIGGRAIMVTDSAVWLKAAVTIATRYLAVRTSGDPTLSSAGQEPQLLDYVSIQSRLMPLIATAYALNFTSLYMQRVAAPAGLKEEDTTTFDGEEGAVIDAEGALRDLHSTCAGLKAFSTWATYYGIETCRQCLGGQGYSQYSGLCRMLGDFAVQCTWEGDNTVMALQTARYLVSSFQQLKRGEVLVGSVSYLNSLPRINQSKRQWKVDDRDRRRGMRQILLGDMQTLLDAFRFLLAQKVEYVATSYEAKKAEIKKQQKSRARRNRQRRRGIHHSNVDSGVPSEEVIHNEAWNSLCHELVDTSKAHCYYVMSCHFVEAAQKTGRSPDAAQRELASSLDTMCRLFLLSSLSNWFDWFLAMGYMSKSQFFMARDAISELCQDTRRFAVLAVDAFGYSDTLLRSPLGRKDGTGYEEYFKKVNSNEENGQVASYYHSHIKPILQSSL